MEKVGDRPSDDLKEFSATIATDFNDLPRNSPHGSDLGENAQFLGLTTDPNARRGTAMAHYDIRFNISGNRKINGVPFRHFLVLLFTPVTSRDKSDLASSMFS